MPYGRKSRGWNHLRGSGRYGYRKSTRSRNQPVANAYKANRLPRRKTSQNKKAIFTLAKQVRANATKIKGSIQTSYQSAYLSPYLDGWADDEENPTNKGPIGFLANSFYDETSVNKVELLKFNVNTSGVPTWNPANLAMFRQATMLPSTALGTQYQWLAMNDKKTQVSLIQYAPISAKYTITFNVNKHALVPTMPQPPRYRVTFFRLRPRSLTLNTAYKSNYALPAAGGAYWHMCEDNPDARNCFSSKIHEILADRWVTFKVPDYPLASSSFHPAQDPPSTTPVEFPTPLAYNTSIQRKTVSVTLTGKQLARRGMLRPNMADGIPSHTVFQNQIPISDAVWCLISSSQSMDGATSAAHHLNEIHLTRTLKWRDEHGVSTT